MLYHSIVSAKIDNPPDFEEIHGLFEPQLEVYAASFDKNNKIVSTSRSHDILKSNLTLESLPFEESVFVKGIYEIDFVIHGVAVELLGWSYHLHQNAEELDIQTRLKLRHLLKLNYNIILITSFNYIQERLTNTLKRIAQEENPTCLWIRDKEVIDVVP